jgi:hypothetical protein
MFAHIFGSMIRNVTDSPPETPYVFYRIVLESALKTKDVAANSHLPRRNGTASFNFPMRG